MKHASLVDFLRGELSPEDFGSEIAEEVGDCIRNWKSGGVGHITITDGPMTEVTREQDAVNEAIFFLEDDSCAPTDDELRGALARLSS